MIQISSFPKFSKKVTIPVKDLLPVVTIVCNNNIAKTTKSDSGRVLELTIALTFFAKRS